MSRRLRLENWHRRLSSQGAQTLADRCAYAVLSILSLLYGSILWFREKIYLSGLRQRYRATIPVVSIGNITVGGTGKTPLSDFLVKYLQKNSFSPAIVSRGYGRKVSSPVEIVCAGEGPVLSPEAAGDEPYLLAKRNPEAIVVVSAHRAAGIRQATRLGADVIVLDDGFQHLSLARDLDIVLLDAGRPLGNGLPLPAGMLREFPSALKRASAFILTRSQGSENCSHTLLGKPLLTTYHRLGVCGWDLSGKRWPLKQLQSKKIAAFCGIAVPGNFFSMLEMEGVQARQSLSFPDHVCYDHAQLERLNELASGVDLLVTTEKDAVKLLDVGLPCPCVAIPLEIDFHAGHDALENLFLEHLSKKKETKMTLSKELLDILACPACKQPVKHDAAKQMIVCSECKLGYPIKDEIPVMLIDEAQPLDD